MGARDRCCRQSRCTVQIRASNSASGWRRGSQQMYIQQSIRRDSTSFLVRQQQSHEICPILVYIPPWCRVLSPCISSRQNITHLTQMKNGTRTSQLIALIVNSATANVPALTGIALTSVGTIPRQKPAIPPCAHVCAKASLIVLYF